MVVSWTPLFVLFHLGLPAGRHKTLSENSNDAIPGGGKREKSLSKVAAETDGISGLHAFVIDCERRWRSIVFCSSATTSSSIGAIRVFDV
jgi:hypothetical protein